MTATRLRTLERTLPVKLTPAEEREHGKLMAKARRDHAAMEEQRKGVNDDFKSRLAGVELEIERHARAVETGEEPRLVECADELSGNVVITLRLDTGETIATRPATSLDRQTDLLGEPDADEDDPPPAKRGGRKAK